jgi:hypothetical protein
MARMRADLWRWFDDALKDVGQVDTVQLNGDAIDGAGYKSQGVEQLTTDRAKQVAMVGEIMECVRRRVKPSRILMTYGTPYHVGEGEDWEAVLAKDLKAEKIEAEGHYDLNGLQIAARHYLGNSSSPVSSMTAMRGAQVRQMLWALRGQQPRANLIIRSHIHRCYHVGEPALNFQGWTTPALQGLGARYGARQIDGLPVDFGFLVIEADSVDSWGVIPHLAPLAMEAAAVTQLT